VTEITDTLHEYQYTLLIMLRSFLLKMRNVSDKICRENHNTHSLFVFLNHVMRLCWEILQSRTGHRW